MSLGLSLEATLNTGEEIRFKQKYKKLIETLTTQLPLSHREIEHLCIMYYKLQITNDGKSVPVRRTLVNDVLHKAMDITEYDFLPYIVSFHDNSLNQYMSLESWIRMWALYLRGTFEEKITYCFSVYKSMGLSHRLLRQNMIQLLKSSLIKDNNEDDIEAVRDLVDMITKKMDHDRDGTISFQDFRATVLKKPGLLETFGTVLPSRLAVYAFKSTFVESIRKK